MCPITGAITRARCSCHTGNLPAREPVCTRSGNVNTAVCRGLLGNFVDKSHHYALRATARLRQCATVLDRYQRTPRYCNNGTFRNLQSRRSFERQLPNFPVPKGSKPVHKFLKIEDHCELIRDAGIQVDALWVYGVYVVSLPPGTKSNSSVESESCLGLN